MRPSFARSILVVLVLATPWLAAACNKSEPKESDKPADKTEKTEKKKEDNKPKGCDPNAWKSPDGVFCFVPPDGFKPQDVQKDQIDQYGDKVNTSVAFAKGSAILQLKWGTASKKFDDMKKLAQDSAATQTKGGGSSSVEDLGPDAYVFHSQFKGAAFKSEGFTFKLPTVLVSCELTDFGHADDPIDAMKKACKTIRAQ